MCVLTGSSVKMGMDSGVHVSFYDAKGVIVRRKYIDCDDGNGNCEYYTLQQGEKGVRVCFTTEYSTCLCPSEEEDNSESEKN